MLSSRHQAAIKIVKPVKRISPTIVHGTVTFRKHANKERYTQSGLPMFGFRHMDNMGLKTTTQQCLSIILKLVELSPGKNTRQ